MNSQTIFENTIAKEYSEYLDTLAEEGQNVIFLNSSALHASMVMSRIFKHSKKEVLIMAGKLNGDVSNDSNYILELVNFIMRGGKLRILLSNYDTNNSPPLFKFLKFFSKDQVVVKQTDVSFILHESGEEVHFTVGTKNLSDNSPSMYRLEHDINNYLATGNFNDPEVATKLQTQFYQIFNSDKSTIVATF